MTSSSRKTAVVGLVLVGLGWLNPAGAWATPAAAPQAQEGSAAASSVAVDLGEIVQVSAGGAHTCAVTRAGGVKCWGNNDFGQLGDGTTRSRGAPVAVLDLSEGVVTVSAGGSHTCALMAAGDVKCWGNNQYGQLGDGTTTSRPVPVDVLELNGAAQAVNSGSAFNCALMTGGAVRCWGKNDLGQLGDGTTIMRLAPVDVLELINSVRAIDAGASHACAITDESSVKCWGDNFYGALGDGTTTRRLTPVTVVGLTAGVQAVTAGDGFSCAVTIAGSVKCWGHGSSGELGNGVFVQRQLMPVDVVDLAPGVRAVSAGGAHTCAVKENGGAACWGLNWNGQVGAGGTASVIWRPVDVVGLADGVMRITANGAHSCAVLVDGDVKCWGWNGYGQLGDGTTVNRPTPVDVWDITTYDCTAVTELPQPECRALVTLFAATNGPLWLEHTGWLRTATPCSWYGVTCAAGHVSALDLPANNLVAELPAALGGLSGLQRLDLHGNALTGPLPALPGDLNALQQLDLSANQLSGALPASLSQLPALRTLDLSHNLLRGEMPFHLADWRQLTHLDLSHNSLTGYLPFGDNRPSTLEYLDLSHNRLESWLPWVLTDVRGLTHLDLSHNALFWDIPFEYGGLHALTYLDLSANRLTGVLQPTLGDLHALTYLDLSANHLTYHIPPELGRLGSALTTTAAITINLAGNHLLDGIPATLGGIAGLRSLDLSGNQLSGAVPAAIADRTLAYLNLNYNQLEPTDPRWHDTQTVAPTDLRGRAEGTAVRLTWTPIAYGTVGPYEVYYARYEISYATDPGGPFTVAGRTTEPGAASYTVAGLAPGAGYVLRVRTFTPAHNYEGPDGAVLYQANNLWSDYTPLVSVHLAPPATPTPTGTPGAAPPRVFLPLVWQTDPA